MLSQDVKRKLFLQRMNVPALAGVKSHMRCKRVIMQAGLTCCVIFSTLQAQDSNQPQPWKHHDGQQGLAPQQEREHKQNGFSRDNAPNNRSAFQAQSASKGDRAQAPVQFQYNRTVTHYPTQTNVHTYHNNNNAVVTRPPVDARFAGRTTGNHFNDPSSFMRTRVQSVPQYHEPKYQQRSAVRHYNEAPLERRSYWWHGFVFGQRHHDLREGCVRIYIRNRPYYYDEGIFFLQVDDGYQEVYPPVGALIPQLPDGAVEIDVDGTAYYYAGGAFYVQQDDGYLVVPAPMGVIVPDLPPGSVQVSVYRGVAYQCNNIYYRPVWVEGYTRFMTFQP